MTTTTQVTTVEAPYDVDGEVPFCAECGTECTECRACNECGFRGCACEVVWVARDPSCYVLRDWRTCEDVPEDGYYCTDHAAYCSCPGCDPWGYAERRWEAMNDR